MDIFYIIIISLLLHPILAKTVLLSFRNNSKATKKVIFASVGSSFLIIISMILGVSTISSSIDCILFFSIYFPISLLLFCLYSLKNKAIKVFAGILQLCIFGIGYLSCTIGLLGVGLISNDFRVAREIAFSNGIVYRQYSLGSAPGDYRGIKVSIQKRTKWFPGFELELFTKTYERLYDKNHIVKKDYAALYSNTFPVKYSESNNTLILLDSVKKDTIKLK